MHLRLRNDTQTEKFIWTITNFNRIPPDAGSSYKSSIIHKKHARKVWRFFLYPESKFHQNYVAAYFAKAFGLFDPELYNCTFSIGRSYDKPAKTYEYQSTDLQMFCIGGDNCFRRDTIEKLRHLTVQCEISTASHKSCFPSIIADFENLSSDLTVLYNYPDFSDLTVVIQQHKFYLHTCVLFARCRRLCHVFGYQSFSQVPETVEISNILPSIFHQLMWYLYSGKLSGSKFSLDFFSRADELKLQSFKQSIYEKVQEHHTRTEVATQTLRITWNLKEMKFRERDATPFVQLFHAKCCMSNLAVRFGISEDGESEKHIDISFRVFLDTLHKPVSILCVMSLYCNGKVRAYKKHSHNIEPDEEWHFPLFLKLSDIPEINEVYAPCLYLTAEISLSDGCPATSILHTKTRLFNRSSSVIYPERLGCDLGRLLSKNAESRFKSHDISLKSVDNRYIPAHKAILFARWPAIRNYILYFHDKPESILSINLTLEEIQMLLGYIYTGSLPAFNHSSAKKLLNANAKMECPSYIVEKCKHLLYGDV